MSSIDSDDEIEVSSLIEDEIDRMAQDTIIEDEDPV